MNTLISTGNYKQSDFCTFFIHLVKLNLSFDTNYFAIFTISTFFNKSSDDSLKEYAESILKN